MIVFKVDQMVIFQTDVTLTRVSLLSTRKLKKKSVKLERQRL